MLLMMMGPWAAYAGAFCVGSPLHSVYTLVAASDKRWGMRGPGMVPVLKFAQVLSATSNAISQEPLSN